MKNKKPSISWENSRMKAIIKSWDSNNCCIRPPKRKKTSKHKSASSRETALQWVVAILSHLLSAQLSVPKLPSCPARAFLLRQKILPNKLNLNQPNKIRMITWIQKKFNNMNLKFVNFQKPYKTPIIKFLNCLFTKKIHKFKSLSSKKLFKKTPNLLQNIMLNFLI